jgi:pyruvate dehydrogenase E2 component (dihydrolipoamide acetyltransferase)
MPELAASATTATLSAWTIREGASFGKDDPIALVETEKAQVEVTGEADGSLLKILVAEGAEVPAGEPIAVLGLAGEDLSDVPGLLAGLGINGAGSAASARLAGSDSAASAPPADPALSPESTVPERVFASPLARRMAREAGLPFGELTGTGPGGRIVRRDVVKAIKTRDARQRPAPASAPHAPVVSTSPAPFTDVPHPRVRSIIAARLTESVRSVPPFYVRAECDVAPLLALRAQVNQAQSNDVSLTAFIVKAVAMAHTRVPEMNVAWLPSSLRRYSTVDVGVAVATDAGVVAPVVRAVECRTLSVVAKDISRLAAQARAGAIAPADLEGGTITVTNLGMYGTREFAAIINSPQAAVLAVGAVCERPMVANGTLTVGKAMTMVLSVDHRPVDGAIAARWIGQLTHVIEHPLGILV